MDVGQLQAIVRDEALDSPVLYGVGTVVTDAVVLARDDHGAWRVWVSDERGGAMGRTLRVFDTESDALEYVLQKLRQVMRSRRSIEEWRR